MKKIILSIALALATLSTAQARSSHREPPRHDNRRPPVHHDSKKRSSWGWGLNFTPDGVSVGVGKRVGKHGVIGVTIPITPNKTPAVKEKETVIIQQPVVVQQPVISQPAVQQPVIIAQPPTVEQQQARTWVDGYWRITRSPDGSEVSRIWVPGHWE